MFRKIINITAKTTAVSAVMATGVKIQQVQQENAVADFKRTNPGKPYTINPRFVGGMGGGVEVVEAKPPVSSFKI